MAKRPHRTAVRLKDGGLHVFQTKIQHIWRIHEASRYNPANHSSDESMSGNSSKRESNGPTSFRFLLTFARDNKQKCAVWIIVWLIQGVSLSKLDHLAGQTHPNFATMSDVHPDETGWASSRLFLGWESVLSVLVPLGRC